MGLGPWRKVSTLGTAAQTLPGTLGGHHPSVENCAAFPFQPPFCQHSQQSMQTCYLWEQLSRTRLPLSHPFLGTVKSHEVVKSHSQILRKVYLGKLYDKNE